MYIFNLIVFGCYYVGLILLHGIVVTTMLWGYLLGTPWAP